MVPDPDKLSEKEGLDIAFMLACWASCLASGYAISGSILLGIVELAAWHFSMTVLVQVRNLSTDKEV